jgi:CHASE3 domain sensor protein
VTDEFAAKRRTLVLLAVGLAIGGITVFALCVRRISANNIESSRRIDDTHQVLAHLDATIVEAQAAETGQRGFLLTGRESYLGPYEVALGRIRGELDSIDYLTRDNKLQQENLRSLRNYTAQKFDELAETIRLRREQGLAPALALVLTDRGKLAMDEIRTVLGNMRMEEERLLSVYRADDAKVSVLLYVVCAGIVLVAIIATATIIWLLRWIGRLQTGLVTVCAWTREVRYEGRWMNIDEYLQRRFGLSISHGISDKAAAEILRDLKKSEIPPV